MTGTGGEARLYLDEDIPYRAADVATALGLDAIAARDAHRSLPQDYAFHLQTAAADQRVMVTYNRDDFLLATRDAFAAGLSHAGLLVLTRQLPREPARIGQALHRWVTARVSEGRRPMQAFEVDFLSE